jgi:hypothetical protein
VPYTIPPEYQNLNDGAPLVGGPGTGALASPIRGAYGPGSPAETSMINTLIAGDYGTTPNKVPPVATVLAGPLLRGSQVTVK